MECSDCDDRDDNSFVHGEIDTIVVEVIFEDYDGGRESACG